jgi:hypothetical protein
VTLRQQRGRFLAANAKIVCHNGQWIVPSQTNIRKRYFVNLELQTCTCEDFRGGTSKCKHLWAVEDVARQEAPTAPPINGNLDQSTAPALSNGDKALFKSLLHDLCCQLITPPAESGRPRIPLADIIFSCVWKTFSELSARGFDVELRAAHKQGYISRPICWGSVLGYFQTKEMTKVVRQLIRESAHAVSLLESDFVVECIDSLQTTVGTNTRIVVEVRKDADCSVHGTVKSPAAIFASTPFRRSPGGMWFKFLGGITNHRERLKRLYARKPASGQRFDLASTELAATNELLARILCHNIRCVIHAQRALERISAN